MVDKDKVREANREETKERDSCPQTFRSCYPPEHLSGAFSFPITLSLLLQASRVRSFTFPYLTYATVCSLESLLLSASDTETVSGMSSME